LSYAFRRAAILDYSSQRTAVTFETGHLPAASASNPGFTEHETRFFLAIFYYPKPVIFQLPNPSILRNLELLLHSNISDSDNTEVADWRV